MEAIEKFNKTDFGFDINSLPDEKLVFFKNIEDEIEIILVGGEKIILNLNDFTYNFNGITFSFSPFSINFDFVDNERIKEIYFPYFLSDKYFFALEEKRKVYIEKNRKNFKSSYDSILNTFK